MAPEMVRGEGYGMVSILYLDTVKIMISLSYVAEPTLSLM
jgi:hypothetical protein